MVGFVVPDQTWSPMVVVAATILVTPPPLFSVSVPETESNSPGSDAPVTPDRYPLVALGARQHRVADLLGFQRVAERRVAGFALGVGGEKIGNLVNK